MVGLADNSEQKEIKVDKPDKIIKYSVSEEVINKKDLKIELDNLLAESNKPTDKELQELGKWVHPYYTNPNRDERIAEIKAILGV